MKKIIIQAPGGTDPKFKLWAKEAAQEMLSIFPEYKSSFKVEFDDCRSLQKTEISQTEFDQLPDDDFKKRFIKLPGGKYLVPYASEQWYLQSASEKNKQKGVQAVDMEEYTRLKAENMLRENSQDLIVTLLNEKIEPSFYGYGIEKLNAVLSTQACTDKELFITIFIHEFGHILKATHDQRGHTHHDPDLGIHCTNNKCIMGESGYIGLTQERLSRKQTGKPPFCDECIASMRQTLENMPGLVKAVAISHQNALPVLPHNDDNWKEGWRQHYKGVAARDKNTYHEDVKNKNFVADITRADGSKLNVEANNEYNLSMGVLNADGQDEIPTIKDFADVVAKAAAEDCQIEFAAIEDDEFKARLLIACLEASPRVNTKGAPHLSPEFLKHLDAKTKSRLAKVMQNSQPGQQSNLPPAPNSRQANPHRNNRPQGKPPFNPSQRRGGRP